MAPFTPEDLKTSSYHYELPKHLIAERPASKRDKSRLLEVCAEDEVTSHHIFSELPKLLPPNSVLVLNNSRVFPCRAQGERATGGKVEVFFLSPVPSRFLEDGKGVFKALLKSSHKKRVGEVLSVGGDKLIEVISLASESDDGLFEVALEWEEGLLDKVAQIPIPPYIRQGKSDEQDIPDYQTVYAAKKGSVAAPTAGLHFSEELLETLGSSGHEVCTLSLDVGLGTFRPVSSEGLEGHQMHSENFHIPAKTIELLNRAKKDGRGIYAVGTTSLRALESSYCPKAREFKPAEAATSIFLHPGVDVHSIDGLITNFHLPQSSLIMLVSALLGRIRTLDIYQEAIEKQYRFFSYGDAMLIHRKKAYS